MTDSPKTIQLTYHALLREERGAGEDTVRTQAATAADLYAELKSRHKFSLEQNVLRVAVNDRFCGWAQTLEDNDRVVFVPPVAGG